MPGGLSWGLLYLSASPTYGYNSYGNASPESFSAATEPLGLGGLRQVTNNEERILPTRETQIKNPADMLSLGDGSRLRTGGAEGSSGLRLEESLFLGRMVDFGFPPGDATLAGMRDDTLAQRRHGGRLNMAFCDGHVESGKLEQWYFSEADFRRWRTDDETS